MSSQFDGTLSLWAVLVLLVAAWEHSRHQAFHKGLLRGSQDDLRDNILNYNEQGGGEEDQVRQRNTPPLHRPGSPSTFEPCQGSRGLTLFSTGRL